MSERRRYTKREKVTAVVAAMASSVAAAAETEGIPESTIHYWMDSPEFADIRAKTRDELGAEAKVLAHVTLDHIRQRITEFDPRDLAVLWGILVDKSQLLSGGATGRTEHKDITDSFDDAEWESLKSLLREAADAGV